MELDKEHTDETKNIVLIELEKMFSDLTHRFSTKENHDKLNFLLDIESQMKQKLMEIEYKSAAGTGS
jgi:hypothetical protein